MRDPRTLPAIAGVMVLGFVFAFVAPIPAAEDSAAVEDEADEDEDAVEEPVAAEPSGEAGDRAADAEADEPKAKPAGTKDAKGNVKLNEVEIRGELEKPKIFFILPKAQRDAESRQRRIRFYPDILEPLDKDRFEEEARVLYQHGIPAE